MRTDFERIAKYLAKTVPGTVGLKVAAQLAVMKTGFSAAIQDLVDVEGLTRGILNGKADEGVSIIQYPFYLNFSREIYSRVRNGITGPTLVSFATELAAKYVSFDLDLTVLQHIALACFTIVIPNGNGDTKGAAS